MSYLSADDLLAISDAEDVREEYDIAGLGKVALCGLSLETVYEAREAARETGEWDGARWETLLLQHGILEPRLTYDQARKLRRKGANVIQPIIEAVLRLSGLTSTGEMSAEAVDAAEASFRGR